VKQYLEAPEEASIYQEAVRNVAPENLEFIASVLGPTELPDPKEAVPGEDEVPDQIPTPVCDRCHNLIHHNTGVPIVHPTIAALNETIASSPFKRNHIYHVIDAADFPMSFYKHIVERLDLAHLRTKNRRSRNSKYVRNFLVHHLHFIITRCDLLAPTEEQVNSLRPVLLAILRKALPNGDSVRLTDVSLVSSNRGWGTKKLKEDIANSGGGKWLVGKANVGKSKLFETIFPKGGFATNSSLSKKEFPGTYKEQRLAKLDEDARKQPRRQLLFDDPFSLLPPRQPETKYPVMPIISDLPGTTAAPIRVPFGNGNAELIDLPGLHRGDLPDHVAPVHRASLLMRARPRPTRIVMKPGQSLLLGGGLVRISPVTEGITLMVHPFISLDAHLTATHKAEAMQAGERETTVQSIMREESRDRVRSAGTFVLADDVTVKYAGPLAARAGAGIRVERLPFRVFATDILVEGCGWVEVLAEIRRPREGDETAPRMEPPTVEVFSPGGKYVAQRQTISAYWLADRKPKAPPGSRPRRSMKGVKKVEKKKKKRGFSLVGENAETKA
jgi:hypothetical protein